MDRIIQFICIFFYFISMQCNAENTAEFITPPSKILIWPSEFSHWINLKIVGEALVLKGHRVTVLRPSGFKFFLKEIKELEILDFETENFSNLIKSTQKFVHTIILGKEKVSAFNRTREMIKLMSKLMNSDRSKPCEAFLKRKDLIEKLRKEKYDVILTDPFLPCAEIIAALLGIPHIDMTNLSPADKHFAYAGAPTPLSHIPMSMTGFTEEMTFLQRTMNTIVFVLTDITVNTFKLQKLFQPLVDEHLGHHIRWQDLMANASLWLIRSNLVHDYPRPYTPNMKFVGGLTGKQVRPLTKEYKDFLSSSGEDGFVVFSLGSMISSMHISKANMFASALSKLKQKVIWRYSGERPGTLGSNTKLVDWLPQNDLLAHPNCKLFITHGGNSGLYEGITHGIPMLGLPLFGDQTDNLFPITARGGAIMLDASNLDENEMLKTMQELIHNKRYKEIMMELSKRHRDEPMSPLDTAVYWIEYVIRHKGAYHLRTADRGLYWFQYYLLDVILFLLMIFLVVLHLNVKVIGLVWRQCKRMFKPANKVKKN